MAQELELEIEVASNFQVVNTTKKKIHLPEVAKFYAKNDTSKFMPRGIVLFAIIPKYEKSTKTYLLIEVERNIQKYVDFVPDDDCKQKAWLNDGSIRKTAFEIMTKSNFEFTEIPKEEFESERVLLINKFRTENKYPRKIKLAEAPKAYYDKPIDMEMFGVDVRIKKFKIYEDKYFRVERIEEPTYQNEYNNYIVLLIKNGALLMNFPIGGYISRQFAMESVEKIIDAYRLTNIH